MNRDADNLADVQWIAQCARRLRAQWPHADPLSVDEAAADLWHDAVLRALPPADAAAVWLGRGPYAVHEPAAERTEGSRPEPP